MKTVSDLQEALARFSPDARLSQPLDVQGPSPATDCIITTEMSEDDKEKLASLEEERDDLIGRRDELKRALGQILDLLPTIATPESQSAVREIIEEVR